MPVPESSRHLFQRTVGALVVVAGLVTGSVSLSDDGGSHVLKATQAVQAQLQRRIADDVEARGEYRALDAVVSSTREKIRQLKVDLERAAHRLRQQTTARAEAENAQEASAAAVDETRTLLERHQRTDALQVESDEALIRLQTQQNQKHHLEEQLAQLRRQWFRADQSFGEAVKAADNFASQATGQKDELTTAREVRETARRRLDAAQGEAIQAVRDVDASRKAALAAKFRANRAAQTAKRFSDIVSGIEQSLLMTRQADRFSGADLSRRISQLEALREKTLLLAQYAEGTATELSASLGTGRDHHAAAAAALAAAEATRCDLAMDHAKKSRTHFSLQRELARLQASAQFRRETATRLATESKELASRIETTEKEILESSTVLAELNSEWVARRREAEAVMEPLGRFVSFSRKVAPVFARRCTACHNTRAPQGRLNMNSFAALMNGGESGEVIVPYDSENSLLLMMIEDGLMPKEADPLTPDEINTIRRWIDVGAPVDAGILETADLFDIMPEKPQPFPPPTYRVPVPVLAVAFSPDGQLLATSGYHEVLLWRTDGTLVRRITNVAERVNDLVFAPDGDTIAVAAGTPGQLGEVKLFRVYNGEHLATLVRTTDSLYAVAISADGQRLAAGGTDRRVYVVDMETHDVLLTIEEHSDAVLDVAWSPDSARFVSASHDSSCRIFDVATGTSVRMFREHGAPVYTAGFLPDGESVVSGGADRALRVWSATGDEKGIRRIEGFGDEVFRLAVTADGHVYSAGADREIREHRLSDGELVRTLSGHADWVYALSIDDQGSRIASGCYDGEVRLWNAADGTMTASFVAVPNQSADPVESSER